MGRSHLAPEVFNCSAPDTGNMETILRYGTEAQKERWLKPLLAGEIRSAFAMTEPDVASSDATNVASSIVRDGDDYVINGRKWYTTGATDPRCKIIIFMGQTDPESPDRHRRQSMILVPKDAPGRARRALAAGPRLLRRAGSRLGSDLQQRARAGRATSCSARDAASRSRRGASDRAASIIACGSSASPSACSSACAGAPRSASPSASRIAEQTVTLERIAEARIMIEQARLLTLKAAYMMDTVGNKAARQEIAMIKVVAPNMAQTDRRLGDPGCSAAAAPATIISSPRRSRRRACCASPTDPTRCIATRSASSNCAAV